jgi:uncharacterized protein
MMISFLDTNIFIYAAGRESHLKEPCKRILLDAAVGTLPATTSVEVLQELLHVFQRRAGAEFAVTAVRSVLEIVGEALPVTEQTLSAALDLLDQHDALPVRDVIHLATMLEHGITQIISADTHFNSIEGIVRIDPADYSPQ